MLGGRSLCGLLTAHSGSDRFCISSNVEVRPGPPSDRRGRLCNAGRNVRSLSARGGVGLIGVSGFYLANPDGDCATQRDAAVH